MLEDEVRFFLYFSRRRNLDLAKNWPFGENIS
jgi:hypothetical protein